MVINEDARRPEGIGCPFNVDAHDLQSNFTSPWRAKLYASLFLFPCKFLRRVGRFHCRLHDDPHVITRTH
jgi:hypothetical protein